MRISITLTSLCHSRSVMQHYKNDGHQLIEQLIVMLLTCTLLGLVIPNFKHLYNLCFCRETVSLLANHLGYARQLALTRHQPTRVCPSLDFLHCTNEWKHALLIVQDKRMIAIRRIPRYVSMHFNHGNHVDFNEHGFTELSNGQFDAHVGDCHQKLILNRAGHITTNVWELADAYK